MEWRDRVKGFTQNGIHSSELKVYWTPDAQERGDFFSEYEILDLERSWIPGGEYFHTRVTSKKKELECYYEQVTLAERERILKWLDRRTSGKLIFDNRPYAAYFVRPSKKIEFKDYLQTEMGEKLYSGTFVITFTAYNPFAELLWDTIDGHEDDEWAIAETGLLKEEQMPAAVSMADTNCLIYNPGTEIGHSIIRFKGKTGSGDLEIYNGATGDKCVIKTGMETAEGEHYEIHSETGRAFRVKDSFETIDFAFHDEGQITFIPYEFIKRDILVNATAGEKTIYSPNNEFDQDMAGRYIWIDGEWKYISQASSSEMQINTPINSSITGSKAIVANMNFITITKASDAEVEQLEIVCKAEVR